MRAGAQGLPGLLRRAVAAVTLGAFVGSPAGALAGPIADPAAPIGFRPAVTVAPTGVPVVNIVAPSAAGTSHNQYRVFDVEAPGVVLNNATAGGPSVLGGVLGANPSFSGAFATVILNEVTGAGASSLAGPLEVFGHAASVIVANPNGVACAGCSFLNATRALLTTGVPVSTGSALGFRVTGGTVSVSGRGLDATGVPQLDLVGGTVSITAPLTAAQQLDLLAGRFDYDYASGAVTPAAGASGGGYGIDVSALGSLSAGRIRLRATDAGVGVRALGGVAATADDLVITASGEVRLAGPTSAARDFNARAAGLSNEGSVVAARAAQVEATGDVANHGNLDAGERVVLTLGGALTNRGALGAQHTVAIEAGALANQAGVIQSRAGALEVTAAGAVDNAGGSLSGDAVNLQAASLTNAGGLVFADGEASLTLAGDLGNAGQMLIGGDLQVTARAWDNRGGLAVARDVSATLASLDNSADGRLAADRDLRLGATGTMNNAGGTLAANRDATVSADQFANAAGRLTAVGSLDLTTASSLSGAGTLAASGPITLRGGSLAPGGTLDAGGSLRVEAASFASSATARSGGDISVSGGAFSNSGSIGSAGGVAIDVTGAVSNGGLVAANSDLSLEAGGAVSNQAEARLLALGDATLRAPSVTNTGGTIQAGGDLTIETQTLTNQRGPITELYTDQNALGSAGGLFGSRGTGDRWETFVQSESTGPGQLLAGHDLTLAVGTGLNEAGLLAAGQNLAITGERFTNQAHQLRTTTVHTFFRWKSKLLGTKKRVQDVYYSWTSTPSTVQAGGALDLALTGTLSNSGNLIANTVNAAARDINSGIFDYYAQTPPTVRPKSAIDLSQYGGLPTGPDQLFTERRDPASRFLLGVDPSLPLDHPVLLLPETLVARLAGFDDDTRFYADPLAEAELLRRAALAETGRAYFVPEARTAEEQRRALYEAAIHFAQAHPGLRLGEALTDEQIAELEAPILWYVTNAAGVLVPTVYLPSLARENLALVAGGLVQASSEVELAALGTLDNAGFIAGRRVSLRAEEVVNQKRSADVGHIVKHEKGYWYEITGDTVQPGGFISAAALDIQAHRLTAISGEFYEAGEDIAAQLKERFGDRARFTTNVDRLDMRTHAYEQDPMELVVIAAVAIVLSIVTYGAASALVGAMASAAAGTTAAAAGTTAAAVGGTAAAAGSTAAAASGGFFAAATATTAAGLGHVVIASAVSGMASSAATQLLATGRVDAGGVLKAGLTSGLTAGLTQGLGQALGNETLASARAVEGSTGQVVKTSATIGELGDKIVGHALRAGISGGVGQAVYGDEAGSFGTALVESFVASGAAEAAGVVGAHAEELTPGGHVAAHALVGCAAAAAGGHDCGAGALGAAVAATVNPLVDQFTSNEDLTWRNAQLGAATTAISGLIAAGLGAEAGTAIRAAQNETFNNYLSTSQKTARLQELSGCPDAACRFLVKLKYDVISAHQDAAFGEGVFIGLFGRIGEIAIESAGGLAEAIKDPIKTLEGLKALMTDPEVVKQVGQAVVDEYTQRFDNYARAYEQAGYIGARDAGTEFGALLLDVISLGVGAVKTAAQVPKTVGFVKALTKGGGSAAAAGTVAESAAGAAQVSDDLVRAGAKGAKEAGKVGPKVGSAGGPGAGKDFSQKIKDAARAETDRCVFCDKPTTRGPGPDQSQIDHAIPKSRGGNNTLDNAQNTCRTCNLEKGTRTTDEFLNIINGKQ